MRRAVFEWYESQKGGHRGLSALAVRGRELLGPMRMSQRQRGSDPWVFIQELKQELYGAGSYDRVSRKSTADVLVSSGVVSAKGLPDPPNSRIDQFCSRGGQDVALVDPFSFTSTKPQLSGQKGYAL